MRRRLRARARGRSTGLCGPGGVAGRCTIIIRSPLHSHGNDYTTTARGTGSLSENVSHAAADQKQRAAAAAAAAAGAHTHRQQPFLSYRRRPSLRSRRRRAGGTPHTTHTYYIHNVVCYYFLRDFSSPPLSLSLFLSLSSPLSVLICLYLSPFLCSTVRECISLAPVTPHIILL